MHYKDSCESTEMLFHTFTLPQFMTKASNFSQYYRHTAIFVSFRRFHSCEISRLRISDYPCLTILSRSSPPLSSRAYLHLCSSNDARKDARRRQLVWAHRDERLLRMHRGRDDVMLLQRKCNGSYIPPFLLAPSLYVLCIVPSSPSGRHFI